MMSCNKIGNWNVFFLVEILIRVTLKACNCIMAAVTFDKELLQSCVKAEIEVEHYRDLTKSRNVQSIIKT